jgi:predicted RNase H-like HicB family nuclease
MEVTALIHDCAADSEPGFAATCVEFPEANGQGETVEACLENLRGAVRDVLAYRKERSWPRMTRMNSDLRSVAL